MKKLCALGVLALGLALSAPVAEAYDRSVVFVNQSGKQVSGLYTSNVHKNDYSGENLLDGYILDHTEEWSYDFDTADGGDGYCRFDIMVEFRKGGRDEIMNVNVCEEYEIVIR